MPGPDGKQGKAVQATQRMDRQRRTTPKVDYRKFHLSGDLDTAVQGKVSEAVGLLEKTSGSADNSDNRMENDTIPEDATPEQLQAMLKEQQENSAKLQQQVETMKLRNQLEAEQLHQKQWELAIQELKQAREELNQEHEENMDRIRKMARENTVKPQDQALAWMQSQINTDSGNPGAPAFNPGRPTGGDNQTKRVLLEKLQKQQEDIQRQMAELSLDSSQATTTPAAGGGPIAEQALLLEQIKTSLGPRDSDKDPTKALLRALITAQNKTTGASSTSTLKPEILNRLTGEGEFSMAEWLASLNKQEEGESEVSKIFNKLDEDSDCRNECRHTKTRSGMLDKCSTNIHHKEVWPQKNLGEDWAEEEIEFKQLRFKHLVAGETQTIETCSDPAQILGRLRFLRRISYLKLRGIEWHLLRKMYAAILSSIETGEYSWESNFDRFESILYRKILTDRNADRDHRSYDGNQDHKPTDGNQQEGRKRYCKDYNKAEGCPRSSPHIAWIGTGPNATKRTVHHYCATCLVRDRTPREHPEIHPDCPHRI